MKDGGAKKGATRASGWQMALMHQKRDPVEPAEQRTKEGLDVLVAHRVGGLRLRVPKRDGLACMQHEEAELPPPQRDALGRRRVLLLRARAAARLPPQLGPRDILEPFTETVPKGWNQSEEAFPSTGSFMSLNLHHLHTAFRSPGAYVH